MKKLRWLFSTDTTFWGLGVGVAFKQSYVSLNIQFLCFSLGIMYRFLSKAKSETNGLSWVLEPDLINGNDELPNNDANDDGGDTTIYRLVYDDVYMLIQEKEEHSNIKLSSNQKFEVLRQVSRSFSCMEELGYFVDWVVNDMDIKPEQEDFEVGL